MKIELKSRSVLIGVHSVYFLRGEPGPNHAVTFSLHAQIVTCQ